MRIGCLQFAPQVGDVDNNLNRADALLNRADPEDLDLLVLPELAFSGYNFSSLRHISPYLEPSCSGVSSLWARTTALKYECNVIVGYPEKVDVTDQWPCDPEYYNSAIVVNADGETVGHYRKSHLYYTDETWALEGRHGFYTGRLAPLGRVTMGICMDINPYRFEAPWTDYEFASHALSSGARVVIVSMAWLSQSEPRMFSQSPMEPDIETLMYWVSRLEPIVQMNSEEETIVIFANRTGVESGALYAGTSAVVGIRSGQVIIYGILGRGEKKLLVVDTDDPPFAKLVYRSQEHEESAQEAEQDITHQHHESHSTEANHDKTDHATAMPPNGQRGTESEESSSPIAPDIDESPTDSSLGWHSEQAQDGSDINDRTEDFSSRTDSAPAHRSRLADNVQSQEPADDSGFNSHIPRRLRTQREDPWLTNESLISQMELSDGLRQKLEALLRSESRSSITSMESSNQYWLPQFQPPGGSTILEDVNDYEDDAGSLGYDSPPKTNENRHSIRSDVSVWNDEQGRARTIEPSFLSMGDSSSPVASRYTKDWMKSISQPGGSFTADKKHEARAEQDVRRQLPLGSKRKQRAAAESSPQRTDDARNRSRPSPKPSRSHTIDSGGGRDKGSHSGRALTRERVSSLTEKDPPILRPASRERIRAGSQNRGRDSERPPVSRSGIYHSRVRSTDPAEQDERGLSRGRQRGSATTPDQQKPAHSSSRHRSSRNDRAPSTDIDLSQYALIEEYPSPNCPMHGSRSNSAAGQGSTSQRRTPSTRDRHLSRGARENSRGTNGASASGTPRKNSVQRASSNSRDMTRSAQTSSEQPKRGRASRQGVREQIVEAPEPAPLDFRYGPKTPKAMALEGAHAAVESESKKEPLAKCLVDAPKSVARSRSAVW